MGTLYIVATPIGNLEDITLRAIRVLGEVSCILAEDTRRTRVLLDRHGIEGQMRSLHAHNERARVAEILEALDEDGEVALVSDAGTPLVSDPGERLVPEVLAAGHRVVPLPGASAPLAALVASGLAAMPFTFVGFVPRKSGERGRLFESLAERPETLVFFESPKRVATTLAEMAVVFGARQGCLARELTKVHEEFARGDLRELAERFEEGARGEVTLVVSGAAPLPDLTEAELLREVRGRVSKGDSPKQIAAALVERASVSKRDIYALAQAQRDAAEDAEAKD